MSRARPLSRVGLLVSLVAVAPVPASGAAPAAPAEDASVARKRACVDDFTAGQTLRGEHALRAAREKLVACAQEACPAPVRKDCSALLEAVDAALPSIVPRARDAAGRDLLDVSVRVDGAVVATRLDGHAIVLDPGSHTIRFERGGRAPEAAGGSGGTGDFAQVTVVLAEGEKLRVVDAVLPASSVPRRDSTPLVARPGPPAMAWVFGGVAVVGLSSFAYFGLKGRSEVLDLRASCAGSCDPADVDAARRKLLIADVSLGVTLLTGGLATWLFLRERPATTSAWVDVVPMAGGGVAVLGGRF